jgi:hypothetical protein
MRGFEGGIGLNSFGLNSLDGFSDGGFGMPWRLLEDEERVVV